MSKTLDLPTIREIAAEVASEQNQRLEIVGVKTAGDGQYAEILVSVNGCEAEPCRVSLGVFRDAPPEDVRSTIADSLRQHLSTRRLNV